MKWGGAFEYMEAYCIGQVKLGDDLGVKIPTRDLEHKRKKRKLILVEQTLNPGKVSIESPSWRGRKTGS